MNNDSARSRIYRAVLGVVITLLATTGCLGPVITESPPIPTVPDGGPSQPTNTPPMPGGIETNAPGGDGGTIPTEVVIPTVAPGTGGETGGQNGEGSSPNWVLYFTDPGDPAGPASGEIETALVWLIDHAQQTIDMAVFEFDVQSVADALIHAHQRGVRVRIVYDNEHTEGDPQIDQLVAAGIPAVPDERSALMHNKFFVFDADIVWTGSLNITENGIYRNNNNAIAIISQQLAANYTVEFEEMFVDHQFGPTSPANTPFPGTQVGNDTWMETYFSPDDQALQQLISLVNEAQQSVHFMAFSFTDYDLALAMMNRAADGVEVAGLFESRGANTQYSECPTLLNYGLDVRLDSNPRTMHHKVVIIDGQTVAVGSFNYSTNATESNDENLLFIHNPAIAQLYEQEFYRLMGQANFPVGGECLAGD